MLAKNNGIDLLSLALILRQNADLAEAIDSKADKTKIVHTSEPVVSLTLADNMALQCDVVTSVSITLGDGEYTDGYAGDISFTSGTTATNWNVPTPLFTGTDCENNVFVPQPKKRYNVNMFWDGSYVIGLVVGNDITIS